MTQTPQALLAAETRFVEEGHHVRLDTERHVFLIKSDTRPVTYEITASTQGSEVRFTCSCPAGRHCRQGTPVPCKHAVGCARRLERSGLVRFDGRRWVTAARLAA